MPGKLLARLPFRLGDRRGVVLAPLVSTFSIDFFEALVGTTLPHLRFEDVVDAALGTAGSNYC